MLFRGVAQSHSGKEFQLAVDPARVVAVDEEPNPSGLPKPGQARLRVATNGGDVLTYVVVGTVAEVAERLNAALEDGDDLDET